MKTIVLVFHSYPRKPCVDGLVASLVFITSNQNDETKFLLIPYWRTNESFEAVKNSVETATKEGSVKIVYLDCVPDLPDEVSFLKALKSVPITVIDHHPLKDNSPFQTLREVEHCKFTFDPNVCVAKTMYVENQLSLVKSGKYDIPTLDRHVQYVQYSEYEGMDPSYAGFEELSEVSERIFQASAWNVAKFDSKMDKETKLYYILDNLLPLESDWTFLYEPIDNETKYTTFQAKGKKYLDSSKTILSGESEIFLDSSIEDYLSLYNEADGKLKESAFFTTIIRNKASKVLITPIDILKFGRILECIVRKHLKEHEAQYAILMNSPYINKEGKKMHYFSLRRASSALDARDLVTIVLEASGSSIGGGHPWASGATLNDEEYVRFHQFVANQKNESYTRLCEAMAAVSVG